MDKIWIEYGFTGLSALILGGLITFLTKTLMSKLKVIEDICVKLIDRWNRSDETRDRRHEQMIQEMNDITDDINYIKGKLNSGK
jgi:5-bromo-4-chloroindolyl phosphate hydrolysis protein